MTNKKSIDIHPPDVDAFMNLRFHFVLDDILRKNLAIAAQYVTFLNSLEADYNLPGSVSRMVFKNIIIFLASIVESLINYKLKRLIAGKKIKEADIMGIEAIYQCFQKSHYKISEQETIMSGIKKISKTKKLSDETNFKDLNIAAKRAGFFDKPLFDKAEKLRRARNRLHLSSLARTDDLYSKEDIDEMFLIAKDVIDRTRDHEKEAV